MNHSLAHIDFRSNSQHVPPRFIAATRKSTATAIEKRTQAIERLGPEYWQQLRQAGHDLRLHALNHLDHYLTQLERKVREAGGQVHWARDAEEAREIVLGIAQEHRVKRIAKVKSMLTEEIELNDALRRAGITVFETDLGEYIVQLAGSRPFHPTAPALHMTKEDIASLFHDKLAVDAPPEPHVLTDIARQFLREEFLSAEMGISGANFLIAETGTLVLVTNEGNGRMCTTLPPVHVAVAGIEKVIPDWESLSVLLKLLARSTTGQSLTAYTSCITGTGGAGPREFHLVLVDNGRSRILQDRRARETLLCIRCGACANICPVYNHVGGHAYGWAYSGPIGAILAPQIIGTAVAGDLPFASSLCGACAEICPVKIPFPEILLHLRHRVMEGDASGGPSAPDFMQVGAEAGRIALGTGWLYRLGTQLVRLAQAPFQRGDWLPVLPPPLDRWTMARPLPRFDSSFRSWWENRTPEGRRQQRRRQVGSVLLAIGVVAILIRLLQGWGRQRRRMEIGD